jgi:hypothetical protein
MEKVKTWKHPWLITVLIFHIMEIRPDALCCPEVYRDGPGMLMMMIEDLQWM